MVGSRQSHGRDVHTRGLQPAGQCGGGCSPAGEAKGSGDCRSPAASDVLTETAVLPGKLETAEAEGAEVFEKKKKKGKTSLKHRKLAAAAKKSAKLKKVKEVEKKNRKDNNFKYQWVADV